MESESAFVGTHKIVGGRLCRQKRAAIQGLLRCWGRAWRLPPPERFRFPSARSERPRVAGSPRIAQRRSTSTVSFADLGISNPVVRRARKARHHTDRSPSRRWSSRTPSTARPARPVADRLWQDARLRHPAGRAASSPATAGTSALVLAPTRELASQIVDELARRRPRPRAADRRRLRRRRLRPAERRRPQGATSSSPPPAASRT